MCSKGYKGKKKCNLLNKAIKIESACPVSSIVILRDQNLKNRRWHYISNTVKSIPQFHCVDFPATVSIESLEDGLRAKENLLWLIS